VYLLGADEIQPSDISPDSFVVYQGHHGDTGAYYADVILPGAAYTEKSATYVNIEGRAQSTRAAVAPPNGAREDWMIIRALSEVSGAGLPYNSLEEMRKRMTQVVPSLTDYGNVDPTSKELAEKALEGFAKLKCSGSSSPYQLAFKDFYLTNPISRASSTMAKCSQVI
jgi:NADH dehydrogenase (ubiquinone) Fe-S protein 1